RHNGESIFVVDGHVHFWDASPANYLNEKYADGWIRCFYDYHRNLSPADYVWPLEKYQKYSEADIMRDLFEVGYVDKAIFLPTYLKDWYRNGFNTVQQDAVLAEKYPDRFILNGRFDPRDGEEGLRHFAEEAQRYKFKGVKLYTAEWNGASKGWKLTDPEARRYLDKCAELGVVNIHVHKGPTIWPLNKDAFDVSDVDDVATEYRDSLRFIVEHCGLPRVDDFCWIGTQEANVYGGLAVVMPFIQAKPRYFAEVLAELLWWLGEDKLLFASDYALWSPKWIIDKFMAFEFPEDIKEQRGVDLTIEGKKKILGLNAANLYGLEVPTATAVGE
ncbi:MAG TPA: amidohydrolase family protein, partial [Candidatus Dormibacteraeota bacterium]|nr:amidohydrolase family protein [Candidatus Dormibacteraeota bacterium]